MTDSHAHLPVPRADKDRSALSVSLSVPGSLQLFAAGKPEFKSGPYLRLKTAEWKKACLDQELGSYTDGGLSPDKQRYLLATESEGKATLRIFKVSPEPGLERMLRLAHRKSGFNIRGEKLPALRMLAWLTSDSFVVAWGDGCLQALDLQGRDLFVLDKPVAPLLEVAHVNRQHKTLITVGFPSKIPSRFPVGTSIWDLEAFAQGQMRLIEYLHLFSPQYPLPIRVAYHPDGRHIIAIAGLVQEDGSIKTGFIAREMHSGSCTILHEFITKYRMPKSLEFSPAGDLYIEDGESVIRFDREFKQTGRWNLPPATLDLPHLSLSEDGLELLVHGELGITTLTPKTGLWSHTHQQEGGAIRSWFLEGRRIFALHFKRGGSPTVIDLADTGHPKWHDHPIGQKLLAWHVLPSGEFLLGGKDGHLHHFDARLRRRAVLATGMGPIEEVSGPGQLNEALVLSSAGALLQYQPDRDLGRTELALFRTPHSGDTFPNGNGLMFWEYNPYLPGNPICLTDNYYLPRFVSSDTYFNWIPKKKLLGKFRHLGGWDLRGNSAELEFHPMRPGEGMEHCRCVGNRMVALSKSRIVMWEPDTFQTALDEKGLLRLVEDGITTWTALDGFSEALSLGLYSSDGMLLCMRKEVWRLVLDEQGRHFRVIAKAKSDSMSRPLFCPNQKAYWITGSHWYQKLSLDLETIADFLPLSGDAYLIHVPHPSAGKEGVAPHPGWLWLEGGEEECWDWVEVKDETGKVVETREEKIKLGSRYLNRLKVEEALLDYSAFKAGLQRAAQRNDLGAGGWGPLLLPK